MNQSHNFYELIEECRPQVKEITVTEVQEILNSPHKFTLIDVRESNEWARGKIPHAVHLSMANLADQISRIISDKNSKIILYCAAGYRSIIAAANLQELGYLNVASMAGGIGAWVNSGYKIII